MKTKGYLPNEFEKVIPDLLNGEVVGFPTETVYGLAIVYDSVKAFNQLCLVKKRNIHKPISMMVSDVSKMEEVALVDHRAKKVIAAFMPGAITVVLPAKECLPSHVVMGQKTIGIRIPTNNTALNILKVISKPLLVTSANIASFPSLMKAGDIKETFDGEIASYIEEDAQYGVASTVVDLTHEEVKILREGPITLEEIVDVIKNYKGE